MAWFIGLMSGTSLDGVDGVLAETRAKGPLHARHHAHRPFEATLRDALLDLNRSGADEIHRSALCANALMRDYAHLVAELLASAGLQRSDVCALGAHGQTVRHRPGEFDATGYTVQLVNGALLAELTGIDVVCDFRSRDLAAGGQGAPLVPAFHAACFGQPGQDVAVLNVGGIANLTLLPAQGPVGGFDCGPGNVLMDAWCRKHLETAFDAGGAWASSGQVRTDLLQAWLSEPYFQLPPPKSTGRDLFHAGWLDERTGDASPGDVMATLAEFTAAAAIQALQRHAPCTCLLLVCGGGAHNQHLMHRLERLGAVVDGAGGASGPPASNRRPAHEGTHALHVQSTAKLGIPPDQVEALAFAWLAQRFTRREPGNLPGVTGARAARVLGALYPAS